MPVWFNDKYNTAKFVKNNIIPKLRKLKTYYIRTKDGKQIKDYWRSPCVATAAYKEKGYQLMEYYEEYEQFASALKTFCEKFDSDFSEIYNSPAYKIRGNGVNVRKIGDLEPAQELQKIWLNMFDELLDEMTCNDYHVMIARLNDKQTAYNKAALKLAGKHIQEYAAKENTKPDDYKILKTTSEIRYKANPRVSIVQKPVLVGAQRAAEEGEGDSDE